jgi:hypothetical protein
VISYQVISWFQSLPFKCNLHRYIEVVLAVALFAKKAVEVTLTVRGRLTQVVNPVDP